MKVGIYDPYLDTLGGGERYAMTLAECLSNLKHRVEVFWNNKEQKFEIEKRLGLNLAKVGFVDDIFDSRRSFWSRIMNSQKYDLIFFVSDGSIPFLLAKKNILHFQVPFTGIRVSFLDRIKLSRIEKIVCNSQFTQKYIQKTYQVKSQVIYPPVAVEKFKPGRKENYILSVGRFSETMQAKKQEVLIDCFKNISKKVPQWKLVLAGGYREEDEKYLKKLKNKAQGLKIEFKINASFLELCRLYAGAKIFWHATGFDEDEEKHPEKMEHFGIAVVEAMAAGCVPIVIGKGGMPEIVTHGVDGFLWQTKQELEKLTLRVINQPEMMKKISLQSIKDSQKFSEKVFCEKINEIIKD